MVNIKFAKVKQSAIIPSKLEENAGYDIYACFDEDYIIINPHEVVLIPTGIASAFSSDYYMQLFERGSTGSKNITQHCGVIDSGFRNEWFVPLANDSTQPIAICKEGKEHLLNGVKIYPYEKAICQAVLLPVPKTQIEEVLYEELLSIKSERGLGCLGSSNK